MSYDQTPPPEQPPIEVFPVPVEEGPEPIGKGPDKRPEWWRRRPQTPRVPGPRGSKQQYKIPTKDIERSTGAIVAVSMNPSANRWEMITTFTKSLKNLEMIEDDMAEYIESKKGVIDIQSDIDPVEMLKIATIHLKIVEAKALIADSTTKMHEATAGEISGGSKRGEPKSMSVFARKSVVQKVGDKTVSETVEQTESHSVPTPIEV